MKVYRGSVHRSRCAASAGDPGPGERPAAERRALAAARRGSQSGLCGLAGFCRSLGGRPLEPSHRVRQRRRRVPSPGDAGGSLVRGLTSVRLAFRLTFPRADHRTRPCLGAGLSLHSERWGGWELSLSHWSGPVRSGPVLSCPGGHRATLVNWRFLVEFVGLLVSCLNTRNCRDSKLLEKTAIITSSVELFSPHPPQQKPIRYMRCFCLPRSECWCFPVRNPIRGAQGAHMRAALCLALGEAVVLNVSRCHGPRSTRGRAARPSLRSCAPGRLGLLCTYVYFSRAQILKL